MKGIVSVVLFVAFVVTIGHLAGDSDKDGVVTQFSLGVHGVVMAALFVGMYVVRQKARDIQPWPDDINDVWPEDPEPVSDAVGTEAELMAEKRPCWITNEVHDPHAWMHQMENLPGGRGKTYWCPGVPYDKHCPEKSVHGEHRWPDPDDPETGDFRCPGVEAFEPAEIIQPTEILPPVDVEVDLTGQAPVPCTNRRFHAAHKHPTDGDPWNMCPGRSGKRKAST